MVGQAMVEWVILRVKWGFFWFVFLVRVTERYAFVKAGQVLEE